MAEPNARYFPILKITVEPSMPKHEAIEQEQAIAPLLEAFLRERGIHATVTPMR